MEIICKYLVRNYVSSGNAWGYEMLFSFLCQWETERIVTNKPTKTLDGLDSKWYSRKGINIHQVLVREKARRRLSLSHFLYDVPRLTELVPSPCCSPPELERTDYLFIHSFDSVLCCWFFSCPVFVALLQSSCREWLRLGARSVCRGAIVWEWAKRWPNQITQQT